MPINSNPWYVIDRLDTVMLCRGGNSKESEEVQQLLLSTSDKWAHTGNLTPTDIYSSMEISIHISFINQPQIGALMPYMRVKSHHDLQYIIQAKQALWAGT